MALVLAFGFAAVDRVATAPLMIAIAAALAFVTGSPWLVLRRLRPAAVLALAFVLLFALMAGSTVAWQAGPLRFHVEGIGAGLLVASRLLAIVAVTLALLAPVPPDRLAVAVRGLGAPAVIGDLMLLTLRYVEELRGDILRARTARRMRGGPDGWRGLPQHGAGLAGALIRSQHRAERLWAAMRLRGYGSGLAAREPRLGARDLAWIALAAVLATGTILFDRLA